MDLYVYVVEPNSLRRHLICEEVASVPGMRLIDDSASIADVDLVTLAHSDVLLVNPECAVEERVALHRAMEECPDTCIVLCGTQPDLKSLLSMSSLPVRGFLSFNHLAREEFRYHLGAIACGGAVIEPVTARLLLDYLRKVAATETVDVAHAGTELTLRELEVLALVRRGLSNKEIAMQMHISFGTVRAHLRNIFRKLDVTSRAGAAVYSLEALGGRGGRAENHAVRSA